MHLWKHRKIQVLQILRGAAAFYKKTLLFLIYEFVKRVNYCPCSVCN